MTPVDVAALARRLGLPGSNADVRAMLDGAVADAQADVEAYLGRVVVPTTFVERGRLGWPGEGLYDLTPLDQPVRSITTAVAETAGSPAQPTGLYTVTYVAGLDCTEPGYGPILRYITSAAMNSPEVLRAWQVHTGSTGNVKSVSAEGQSITYGDATFGGGGDPGTGRPGALPTLASLDRWRLAGRRAYIRPRTSANAAPWPYSDALWPDSEWTPQWQEPL